MISKIFKRVYNFLFFFSCSKNFMSSRLTPIPPLCETIIIQPKVMSVWIFMFLRGTNIILLFYFGFKKIKIKVFYPDLRCLFTASFSCPREHESGGSFMIIFIHERYHGLVLGLCVLCQFGVLMLIVSVFSQVGPGLVSFLVSFCLGLCVLGTLQHFGRRIPLVCGFWSQEFVGLGGVEQLLYAECPLFLP